MGVTIFPVVNTEASWAECETDGKILALSMDRLEKVAKKKKVQTLYHFFSMDREQFIIDVLDGDPDDPETFDETEIQKEAWHDPADGLVTIETLLDFVRAKPRKVQDAEGVIEDLEVFKKVLERARDEGAKWHLAQYV